MDPKPQTRMPPALLPRDPVPVSGVICFDRDYADLIRPVARAGGVLAVPANDWAEAAEMHHRSAVWTPVMAGVPVVRSAGHGTSAIYDAAGRVLARASSFDGPVALMADVPIPKTPPRRASHPIRQPTPPPPNPQDPPLVFIAPRRRYPGHRSGGIGRSIQQRWTAAAVHREHGQAPAGQNNCSVRHGRERRST